MKNSDMAHKINELEEEIKALKFKIAMLEARPVFIPIAPQPPIEPIPIYPSPRFGDGNGTSTPLPPNPTQF